MTAESAAETLGESERLEVSAVLFRSGRLLNAGKRVAIVERELIGGECAYWACIPSKTLLRAPEAKAEAARAAGAATRRWTGRSCATITTISTTPPGSAATSSPGPR